MANNNSVTKTQSESNEVKKHQQILTMIALMTSKLLGENTYAKSSIFSERMARGGQLFLDKPIEQSMSLAEFKLSKEVQMGYLVAVDDLRSVTLDQVHYMSLWATGQNDDTIVSRAAGNAFSVYLAQSTDQKKFVNGYKTAVIQFIRAIAGENGVVAKITSAFQKLSFADAEKLANDWFGSVNGYMRGASPFRKITDGTDDPVDERIVQGLFDEINNGYLTTHSFGDDQMPLLGNYIYSGDDFSDQTDLPAMMTQSLTDISLSEAINLFVNGRFSEVLDLLCSLGLYTFVYQFVNAGQADLVGMPVTTATDMQQVIKITGSQLTDIFERFSLPVTLAELAADLPIIDLSNAGTARNASQQNFQQNLSVVMDNSHQPFINDRGETTPVNYGFVEALHGLIQATYCLPILVQYTVTRNQLLAQIQAGDYTEPRNVAPADFNIASSLGDYVEQLARFQVDQLMPIVKRGKDDYDGLNQSGSLSAFNHLMRVAPQMRAVNPKYAEMPKQTKRLYYWLYQSSFASEIAAADRVQL